MKYLGLPSFMWLFYVSSFKKQLTITLKYDKKKAKEITKKAKIEYKKIIDKIPPFEKEDEFLTNILSCAMFSAFLLNLKEEHSLEDITKYYSLAMMTFPTRLVCKMTGKGMFTKKDIKQRKKTSLLKAGERNPYSWNMEFLPYKDGSGYECRFSKCGICTLMRELGLAKYISAMCHLDYDMNEVADIKFIREHTLASNGPYCDCGYLRK